MALWESDLLEILVQGDFGLAGNLVPLVLVIGISWFLSKKVTEALFIQFPLVLAMKLIFPFFHLAFVLMSFALFIMSIIGSKADLLADVKEIPQKVRDTLLPEYRFRQELSKIRERTNSAKSKAEEYYNLMIEKGK